MAADPSPYQPPSAPVGDVGPEGPGLVPDSIAVAIGLGVDKFLTMVVAEEIIFIVAEILGADLDGDDQLAPFLWLDAALSCGFELFAFWVTLWLCRSRRLRVPAATAVLSLIITLVNRWLLIDYGYPQWYELALLAGPPLAFGLLLLMVRKRRTPQAA